MQKMKKYINYSLSKAIPTVAVRKRKADAAKTLIENWLTKYTEFKIENNFKLGLTIPIGFDGNNLANLIDKYGNYSKRGEIHSWPEEIVSAEFIEWEIPYTNFLDLLRLSKEFNLESLDFSIISSIDFILLGNKMFPFTNQDLSDSSKIKSSFLVFYNNSSSLSPNVNFPFSEDNEQFRKYFNEDFIENLPFRINENYLRYHIIDKDKLKMAHRGSKWVKMSRS